MTFAIVIGCYRLPQFCELNARRCRRIFGDDAEILLSDDRSNESAEIAKVAERNGCTYICSDKRRSHFSGDWMAFVSAAELVEFTGSDVALKISQRLIPVLPAFREVIERGLCEEGVQVVLPGRPSPVQVARPESKFFAKFGILTDVLAFKRGAVSGKELVDLYRSRFERAKSHVDCLVEVTWGKLLESKFAGKFKLLPELTNHVPFQPKIYLRKSQSSMRDYEQVAAMEGMEGRRWPLNEWGTMERENYFCRPTRA